MSDSDFLENRFISGETVEIKGETYTIKSYRKHKNFHLLIFEGVSNMNDIQHLKGETVFIDENADDLTLDEHEFHVKDIIGLKVIN
ncbi:ribosome maturation factor RimM, partial [Bacillus safensis]|nr:ribosome maturation factor RimM [Bacillus safensis]